MGNRVGIPWGQPAHSSKAVGADGDAGTVLRSKASQNCTQPLAWPRVLYSEKTPFCH